jgi:hypothetical protein
MDGKKSNKNKECCHECGCENEKDELIKAYFCPKCKSTKVRPIQGWRNAFGIIQRWKCDNCSFQNPVFPIIVANKGKLEKLNKRSKK